MARGCRRWGDTGLINISFARPAERSLRKRYPDALWPWEGDCRQRSFAIPKAGRKTLAGLVSLADLTSIQGRDLILLGLLHVLRQAEQGANGALPLWIRRALRDHIDAGDSGGVAALARRAGCSREHLSRSLRREAGMSPAACLKQARLARACDALARSDDAIPLIAEQVGFVSLGTFYAAFTAAFGLAPAAWRARNRVGWVLACFVADRCSRGMAEAIPVGARSSFLGVIAGERQPIALRSRTRRPRSGSPWGLRSTC